MASLKSTGVGSSSFSCVDHYLLNHPLRNPHGSPNFIPWFLLPSTFIFHLPGANAGKHHTGLRIVFAVAQWQNHHGYARINLTEALPAIQVPMTIDGNSQDAPASPPSSWTQDSPRVVIDGTYVLGCFIGIWVKAPDVTLVGLGVTGFLGAGIMLSAPRATIVGGAVYGNTLDCGVGPTGRRGRRTTADVSYDDVVFPLTGDDDDQDDHGYYAHMNKNYDDDDDSWWTPGWECDQVRGNSWVPCLYCAAECGAVLQVTCLFGGGVFLMGWSCCWGVYERSSIYFPLFTCASGRTLSLGCLVCASA